MTHQSGASIEYSPVEALKRVCEKHHIVYIGGQTILLSIVHIDKQILLATVLSVMSTVHSVPIISRSERPYYSAVHSYIAHLFQHSKSDSTRSTTMRTLSQFPMQSPGW